MAQKIKKGDQVIIIAGSNKGKSGKVLSIAGDRVTVEGINIATVHKKPSSSNPGQILKVEKPVHISNVSHVENGKPVKIKFTIESGKEKIFKRKVRVSKKSGKKIGQ
jgi:large subunit ribosomal protein L24